MISFLASVWDMEVKIGLAISRHCVQSVIQMRPHPEYSTLMYNVQWYENFLKRKKFNTYVKKNKVRKKFC